MLNVIINEKLYDEDFVKNWCTGFEELKERVQQYPPSKVAEISWVPEEDLVKAARLYAKNKPCAFHTRMGLLMNTNNLQTVRAVDLLSAVTGNVDIKGSNILPYPSPPRSRSYVDFFRLHKESIPLELFETRPGYKEWPLIYGYDSPWNDAHPPSAIEAIARGQVKAMIWVNDPVMGLQNSKKIQESLKKLEFMVGIDFFLSPTANLADIVLPSATWLERDMIHDLHYFYLPPKGKRDYHESFVSIGEKVIEPLYECWEERKMAAELIKRMGLKSPIPIDSSDAYNNWRLEPLGITVDELKKKRIVSIPIKYKKYEEIGFQTPSFNVELCSNVLKEQGFDPLPYYEEPPESPYSTPELAKEYPFILISGGRHICFYHGALRQLPWLRELNPEPKVEINPETAEELGIRNGDWVWIETPRRKGERVKLKAELTETVHPKVIHAYSHWWFPERKDDPDRGCFESNINIITYDDPPYDKHSGTPLIRGCLCKIGKVEA
jgi:anaerobic selenocysteine-containing dehydrogenase